MNMMKNGYPPFELWSTEDDLAFMYSSYVKTVIRQNYFPELIFPDKAVELVTRGIEHSLDRLESRR